MLNLRRGCDNRIKLGTKVKIIKAITTTGEEGIISATNYSQDKKYIVSFKNENKELSDVTLIGYYNDDQLEVLQY